MADDCYIVWGREMLLYGADKRDQAYAHADRIKANVFLAHLDPAFDRQWRVAQPPSEPEKVTE